ncbi:hypothetical protein [Enterococcus gilvus]|uniref:hypothetical protein n=1 Tax=Enterococcus gilvus TaxID=160453 RepID=UPI0029142002|nr:hypothetical protein [Enterococcus gilvus]MDU5511939.1 hypothetical protein [Enterococcus gilvus]
MKERINPYNMYCCYIGIPVAIIALMILNLSGYSNSMSGGFILVVTVVANINIRKLKLVPSRKYVAPILLYIVNIIFMILLPIFYSDISNGGVGESYFVYLGFLAFPLQIVMIIFFFISSSDIKKAYPSMKMDAKEAREKYRKEKSK